MFKTLFIIIFIFIFLIYLKSNKEHFNEDKKLSINFNPNNEILFLSNDLINIEKSLTQTLFKKSNTIFYSNESINSISSNNGFIFKPNKNISNFYIGLSNINNDNKEEILETELLDFSINLLGNNFLKINEKVEIYDEIEYLEQDLDYCVDPNIDKCVKSNDTYNYDDNDFLSIVVYNNIIHYLIVKSNKDGLSGLLIHKSKNIPTFPLSVCIINKENDNILENYYFTNTDYEYPENMEWSVELLKKRDYDELIHPKSKKLREQEEIIEEPEKPIELDIPTYERGIRILNDDYKLDENILHLKPTIYNINQKLLNRMYSIKILIKSADKNKNNIIVFDKLFNDKNNKKIFILDKNTNKLGIIKIDLSKYVNIFSNQTLLVKVVLRRGEFTSDELNYVSNEVKI